MTGVSAWADGMAKATTLSTEPTSKVRAPRGATRRVTSISPLGGNEKVFPLPAVLLMASSGRWVVNERRDSRPLRRAQH